MALLRARALCASVSAGQGYRRGAHLELDVERAAELVGCQRSVVRDDFAAGEVLLVAVADSSRGGNESDRGFAEVDDDRALQEHVLEDSEGLGLVHVLAEAPEDASRKDVRCDHDVAPFAKLDDEVLVGMLQRPGTSATAVAKTRPSLSSTTPLRFVLMSVARTITSSGPLESDSPLTWTSASTHRMAARIMRAAFAASASSRVSTAFGGGRTTANWTAGCARRGSLNAIAEAAPSAASRLTTSVDGDSGASSSPLMAGGAILEALWPCAADMPTLSENAVRKRDDARLGSRARSQPV